MALTRTVALAVVVATATTAAAQTPAASEVDVIVVGRDDGLTELPGQLRDILSNPPLPGDGLIQISRINDFRAGDLFTLARPDAKHPTAWVVVEDRAVHIRAAGAGRAQFVFRDITISQPMTDLDRERVGQTLRAALSAVIEGLPGALGRVQAQRAVDFEEPRPPASAPEARESAPPLALIPPGALPAADTEDPGPVQFRLGASLQIVRIDTEFAYAPGAIGSVEWRPLPFRPRLWLSVMEFLPHTYNAPVPAFAASFRVGAGATVPPVPWLQIDLGVGLDWLRGAAFPDGPSASVYRVAVRIGPTDRFRIRSSLTLSLDHVSMVVVDYFGTLVGGADGASHWRPGLTLELWWL